MVGILSFWEKPGGTGTFCRFLWQFALWAQSSSATISKGVPQGSVLGPILFILFINDLPESISQAQICLFADDTSLTVSDFNLSNLEIKAYSESNALLQWFNENKLVLNGDKTQLLRFSINNTAAHDDTTIVIGENVVGSCSELKFLGVNIDNNLKFSSHIDNVCRRLSSGIFVLKSLAKFSDINILLSAYYGIIYPFLNYAVAIWGHENCKTKLVFRLQKRALRAMFRKPHRSSCKELFQEHRILTFPCIYILNTLTFVQQHFGSFNQRLHTHNHNLRNNSLLTIPAHKTSFYKKHLHYNGVALFNSLPPGLRGEVGRVGFEKKCKQFLLDNNFYSVKDYLSFVN